MVRFMAGWFVIFLLCRVAAAQYHAPFYLMGGSIPARAFNGVWLADPQKRTVKDLTPGVSFSRGYSAAMDTDNRHVLFLAAESGAANVLKGGLFRIDPATGAVTTVYRDPTAFWLPHNLLLNQDGDYVFASDARIATNQQQHRVYKLTPGGKLTTLWVETLVGQWADFRQLGRNMDTGKYLLSIGYFARQWVGAILEVETDGSKYQVVSGQVRGWPTVMYRGLQQDFDSGGIEGQELGTLLHLRQGYSSVATLGRFALPTGFYPERTSIIDLQSAPRERIVAAVRHVTSAGNAPAIAYVEIPQPHLVTAINCDAKGTINVGPPESIIDFYRGRHIQSISIHPGAWSLRLSCPRFANKPYVLALSVTGYRPAQRLPDGRRIYLVPDGLTALSLANMLRPYFDSGPGRLDAKGEAQGHLDIRSFQKLNMPIWIAMAVLDPSAPCGIAYLPDTYVMRL